jgi:hypothetical protein
MTANTFKRALNAHWFVLAALVVAGSDLVVASVENWSQPRLIEAAILFDLMIVVPALYGWCYHARGKATVLRTLALSCTGIWICGKIVPGEHHHLLSAVGLVRYVGLAALLTIELKLLLAIYGSVFRKDVDARSTAMAVAKDAGLPEWVARLLAWEIALWRKAWDSLRCLIRRR